MADAEFDKLLVVLKGIQGWRIANKGIFKTETVECPACKGHLMLSIAKKNGHVWGKCETEGCVQWVE